MSRFYESIVSLILCLILAVSVYAGPPEAAVRVASGSGGSWSLGSGMICRIDNGKAWVLTARHVVSGGRIFYCRTHDGVNHHSELRAVDRRADLALLVFAPRSDVDEVPVYKEYEGRFGQLVIYGFGGSGRLRQMVAKEITWQRSYARGLPQFETTTPLRSGDSGGAAVFKGGIVAVMWGSTGRSSTGESHSTIVRFLQQCGFRWT